MAFMAIWLAFLVVCCGPLNTNGLALPEPDSEPREYISPRQNTYNMDPPMDNAMLNLALTRQFLQRLGYGRPSMDMQRKRSYWKQCAFNAVSCFGRK